MLTTYCMNHKSFCLLFFNRRRRFKRSPFCLLVCVWMVDVAAVRMGGIQTNLLGLSTFLTYFNSGSLIWWFVHLHVLFAIMSVAEVGFAKQLWVLKPFEALTLLSCTGNACAPSLGSSLPGFTSFWPVQLGVLWRSPLLLSRPELIFNFVVVSFFFCLLSALKKNNITKFPNVHSRVRNSSTSTPVVMDGPRNWQAFLSILTYSAASDCIALCPEPVHHLFKSTRTVSAQVLDIPLHTSQQIRDPGNEACRASQHRLSFQFKISNIYIYFFF